jgi:hypothetical protein
MPIPAHALTQRDGTSCGAAVAVVAGALVDTGDVHELTGPTGRAKFDREQARVHASVNRLWPRALGMTPAGLARAISAHSVSKGRRYRFRARWGPGDRIAEAVAEVTAGWPVAMLVGNVIPRHWVLIVACSGDTLTCYEPSAGAIREVSVDAVRRARIRGLGFARPFAFVLPEPPAP